MLMVGSVCVETDPSGPGWRIWIHQLFDGLDEDHNLIVMIAQLAFKLGYLASQLFISSNNLAELHKGTNDKNADLDRFWRVEDAGGHDGTMFSENQGHGFREF
jgi:hypothetical protein